MNNLFDKYQLWIEKRKQVRMEKWAITRVKGKGNFFQRYWILRSLLGIVYCFYCYYFFFYKLPQISYIFFVIAFLFAVWITGRGSWQANEEEYRAFLEKKSDEEARIKRAADFMAKR